MLWRINVICIDYAYFLTNKTQRNVNVRIYINSIFKIKIAIKQILKVLHYYVKYISIGKAIETKAHTDN